MDERKMKRLRVATVISFVLSVIAVILAIGNIKAHAEEKYIAVIYQDKDIKNAITIDEPCPIETKAEETAVEPSETVEIASEPHDAIDVKAEDKTARKSLGTYYITRYCSCSKCCGKYANNRPNGIVYGASGKALTYNHSVASPLPFGTVVEIEGIDGQFTVEDRTDKKVARKTNNRIIDIYTASHEEAKEWGCKKLEVWAIE